MALRAIPGESSRTIEDLTVIGPTGGGTRPSERVLGELLDAFRIRNPGVRGIAIADRNGLPVATSFDSRVNSLLVTAMATMVVQSSQKVFENLGLSELASVAMSGHDATVLVENVAGGAVSLIAVLDDGTNIALVRTELDRLAREVSTVLGI